MQTTQKQLNLDGGVLYYETSGSGQPLVLSHAGFLDSRMFDAQFEVLAEHFQVIRYDMRGYGQSDPAQGPLCRRADLHHLLDHLGVEQAHFVGCSNGGTIMLDLALEQPDRVRSLTLVGSTPSGFELQGEPPRYMMEMFEAFEQGDVDRASELQIRIWLDSAAREPEAVDPALRQKALAMNRICVERRTFLIADMQPVCPLDPTALTRLHEVSCPTLIAAGALDHPVILQAANLMAENIPNARKIIIEETGHVPSFERPDVFNTLLLDFLSGA